MQHIEHLIQRVRNVELVACFQCPSEHFSRISQRIHEYSLLLPLLRLSLAQKITDVGCSIPNTLNFSFELADIALDFRLQRFSTRLQA